MLRNKCEMIKARIRRGIISGEYPPGSVLPSEAEIRKRFDVSQGTVNKAMASLAAEGFIRTKTRIGSLVLPVRERKIMARLGIYAMRSTGHIFAPLNTAILDALQRSHYFPVLISLDSVTSDSGDGWLVERLGDAIDSIPELTVIDGQAGFPFRYLVERRQDLQTLIFINRFESPVAVPSVRILSDYELGGRLAASHLLAAGCRRPFIALNLRAVLGDEVNLTAAQLRGFRAALAAAGIDPAAVPQLALDDADRPARLRALFSGPQAPDGVFAESDYIGYLLQRELEALGIRLNRDYRMIGYFDTPWSRDTAQPFPSISINPQGIADRLRETIHDWRYDDHQVLVEPILRVEGRC